MRGGIYVAVFVLPAERCIRVGALGRRRFSAGVYLYVGSAQRNLEARLARHGRRRKPLRWHIDYLARHARMIGAMTIAGGRQAECRTADALARRFARPIRCFGASDCRCESHLFFAGPPWRRTNRSHGTSTEKETPNE